MTTASKNLYVSQPSISKTISELEDWYGTKLFVRINKTLMLTPSGKIVAEYSQKIVDMVEQMDREIKEKVHCGELIRLGVSITTRTDCLSGIMAAFKEKNNDIRVEGVIDSTQKIINMILQNDADFGLVDGKIENNNLIYEELFKTKIVLICSDKHPLFSKEKITAEDISRADFIVRENGCATRTEFERAMSELGIKWNATWVCSNTNASIRNAAAMGLGIGVVTELSTKKDITSGHMRIIPVPGLDINQTFYMVYHIRKEFSESLAIFKKYIADNFNDFFGTNIESM